MSDTSFFYGHPRDGVIIVLLRPDIYETYDDVQKASWVKLNPGVGEGAIQNDDGAWAAPPAVDPGPPPPEAYVDDVPTFMLRFEPQERIAIRASTDPAVQDFYALLQDPRTLRVNRALSGVQGALAYMAGELDLGSGKMATPIIAPARLPALTAPDAG